MNAPQENGWLDTRTQEMLSEAPPAKLAPASTEGFAVVVLSVPLVTSHARQIRAFNRVLRRTSWEAAALTTTSTPFVVKRGLDWADAMLAQFELICCDIVSIILSDDVLSEAPETYLAQLYRDLLRAEEFDRVTVNVQSIPENADGKAFVGQFLDDRTPTLPCTLVCCRKKARIMAHWGQKVGALVECPSALSGR